MTLHFADIRNFTSRSEEMTPAENFDFINSLLNVLSPIIKKHHGFIDKFIGDAIMALYPREPEDALRCAIEMQKKVDIYNKNHPDQEPVKIGIGINTGELMLGTVGEKNRMNVTVISDAVNIASRIESLTKTYDTPILVSEYTFNNIKSPSAFSFELVDEVLMKGKKHKITIYKLLPVNKNLKKHL